MARHRPSLADWLPPRARAGARARRTADPDDDPALQELWAVIAGLPFGCATTYGAVARAAGLPGRARLAGRALKLAPDEMNLPWHRVVGAGGRISFPAGTRQHREQARRLRAEGVAVAKGRVAAAFLVDP